MPKVNLTSQKVSPRATSSVVTRRKRFQMIRAKQQLEDETSSSPFNDSRLVNSYKSMISLNTNLSS